jgi:hypothetical protein
MPHRTYHRVTFPLIPILVSTALMLPALNAWALKEDVIGYQGSSGVFVSVCRVAKNSSTITITKINPGDRFASVELQFVFAMADEAKAMKGIFIQWEKGPGVIGNLKSVPNHKSFDKSRKVLRTTWKRSNSFRIVDKSASEEFREYPWYKILRISVNGRNLVRKQTQIDEVMLERRSTVGRTDLVSGSPLRAPADAGDHKALGLMMSRIVSTQRHFEGEQQKLFERFSSLEETVNGIQKSLVVTSKWYYWGPLISLVLSILFTSVTLFLAFTRLSSGRGLKKSAAPGPMRTRDRLNARFRKK